MDPTIVDTDRHPLDDPALVDRVRAELRDSGCCVLPGFVRAEHVPALRAEGRALAPLAHHETAIVNVYNTDPDPTLPAGHPAHRPLERGNAFVARDRIPADALIQRLHADRAVQGFVAAAFGLPEVFALADPLSGLVLNVVGPGREHPWHFDTNEFTVSLLTQAAEAGGLFQYCPGIRSPQEENLDAVSAVLDGDHHAVRTLELRPGDLQLFAGRYSLHRVSPVEGGRERHTAILAYSRRPGVVGTAARTRQLFGRVTRSHTAPAGPGRVDRLLI
ncbi:arpA protein [Pseudonocardia kujensis]|uniref:HalD/BesD family halogenase n=1 Tax=Pseudonocardia kujensis TaxID=1128675 RepID=UPI001E3061E7|nr:arpA protein [Pseudonocardia kujensis]MCE0764726.1 arpA protein [Pseudonocardia kujensis]